MLDNETDKRAGILNFLENNKASNVVEIDDFQDAYLKEEDGNLFLRLRNLDGSRNPFTSIEISWVRDLPNMSNVLQKGLLEYARGDVTHVTVKALVGGLKNGWVKFLNESNAQEKSWADISGSELQQFAVWVRKQSKSNGTRNSLSGALGRCLKAYLNQNNEGDVEYQDVEKIIHLNDFANLVSRTQSRSGKVKAPHNASKKFMSEEEIKRIYNKVADDVEKITSEWHERQSQLKNAKESFDPDRTYSGADLFNGSSDLLIAWVDNKYSGILPGDREDRILKYGIRTNSKRKPKHGLTRADLRKYFYVDQDDLVPFVILFLLKTAWNSQPLLDLKLSNIRSLDNGSISLETFKNRAAGKPQYAGEKDNDPENPISFAGMVQTLKEMTSRIRPETGVFADYLFLSAGEKGLNPPAESANNFTAQPFKKYVENAGYEGLVPSNIRPSLLNNIANGYSIYEAFNVANHSTLATTLKHYISEDTKRKSTIRLAELNSAVDRWAKTKGVIDPRNRQSGSDIFVATIGFDCHDPWNSPFEKKQRLCQKTGYCVACPNSEFVRSDPIKVAYLLAYSKAIAECQRIDSEDRKRLGTNYRNIVDLIDPKVLQKALELSQPKVKVTE